MLFRSKKKLQRSGFIYLISIPMFLGLKVVAKVYRLIGPSSTSVMKRRVL